MMSIFVEDGTSKIDSNSYISVADADLYFEGRLHKDAWINATEETKTSALIQSARILDRYVFWLGEKTKEEQAMQFPRQGICYEGNIFFECNEYLSVLANSIDSDSIPQEVKDAQCELALVLLQQDTQSLPDTAGFSNISVAGAVDITIDKHDRVKEIPSHVFKLVSHLGRRKGNASRLVRS